MSSSAANRLYTARDREESADDIVVRVRALRKLSLRGVDLTIRKGERVAIIGRTGEGKSVLLRCILGLMQPESGQVEVLGRPVRGKPALRGDLGVGFQSPALLDAFSIQENLELACGHTLSGDQIESALRSLGLSPLDPSGSVTRLSGGQQKRIALLMAMLRGESLIVLDEPTSGLDPDTAERVAHVLHETTRAERRTLLLVTHDYETAVRLCDRFLLLTPAGTLRELDLTAMADAGEAMRDLRRNLAESDLDRQTLAADPPARAGIADRTTSLLLQVLPLSAGAMTLLGAMFVKQSAGLAPIDISRHIPAIVVSAVFRETAPLVVGLLLASRVGSHLAAEVAGMSYTSQLDSMRLLGLSPARMLLLPYWISASIVFPLCIVIGAYAAVLAGAGVAAAALSRLSIGSARFLSLAADAFDPLLLVTCLGKGVLMAACVTVTSYRYGIRPMTSAHSVGGAVTNAVVAGALSIVVVDVVISWFAFGG